MSLRRGDTRQKKGKNNQEDGSEFKLQDFDAPRSDFGWTRVLADLSKNASIMSKPQMLECRPKDEVSTEKIAT